MNRGLLRNKAEGVGNNGEKLENKIRGFYLPNDYSGLKKKCILRLAKAKLKKEKKMTLPILHTPLCCSASNQHKAQLTTIKKDGGRVIKKGMRFLFPE